VSTSISSIITAYVDISLQDDTAFFLLSPVKDKLGKPQKNWVEFCYLLVAGTQCGSFTFDVENDAITCKLRGFMNKVHGSTWARA